MSTRKRKLNASELAQLQLAELANGSNVDLYQAVVDACNLILTSPGRAQGMSSAIFSFKGPVLRLPVVGHPPYKVFWTTEGPWIEAVFPHP